MPKYTYKLEDDKYVFYKDDFILTTECGNQVCTSYKALADRMLVDLNQYGTDTELVESAYSWHATALDMFIPKDHAFAERLLIDTFLHPYDWTFKENNGTKWNNYFGSWDTNEAYIEQLLGNITTMQMAAVFQIINAYNSLNLGFVLAAIMEKYTGGQRDGQFKELAALIVDTHRFGEFDDIYHNFKTFELYYGLNLEEYGPALSNIIDYILNEDTEELNLDDLTKYKLTNQQLIGRNYYHYTDGVRDKTQPATISVSYINQRAFGEESSDEQITYESEGLENYLPKDCWVKRYADENGRNAFYLYFLVVNEQGEIESNGCIEEYTKPIFDFFIPGMNITGAKSYSVRSELPQNVINDLKLLIKGKSLPLDFSLIGKILPQKLMATAEYGDSDSDYILTLNSAFRSAYIKTYIYTNGNGVVSGFSYYWTLPSDECGGFGMFGKADYLDERKEEAIDLILHIYDMYSDEELESLNK